MIRPATFSQAKQRWAGHTRHVAAIETIKYMAHNGTFWAHDPFNRAPIVMTRNGDGSFMPLFWFYDDGDVTFASVEHVPFD